MGNASGLRRTFEAPGLGAHVARRARTAPPPRPRSILLMSKRSFVSRRHKTRGDPRSLTGLQCGQAIVREGAQRPGTKAYLVYIFIYTYTPEYILYFEVYTWYLYINIYILYIYIYIYINFEVLYFGPAVERSIQDKIASLNPRLCFISFSFLLYCCCTISIIVYKKLKNVSCEYNRLNG